MVDKELRRQEGGLWYGENPYKEIYRMQSVGDDIHVLACITGAGFDWILYHRTGLFKMLLVACSGGREVAGASPLPSEVYNFPCRHTQCFDTVYNMMHVPSCRLRVDHQVPEPGYHGNRAHNNVS